jgi:hypothetical protein
MKKSLLFTLFIAAASFVACNKSDKGTPETGDGPGGCFPPTTDCRDVICTAVFVGITVEVKDAGGAPLTLNSFVVTDASGTPVSGTPSPRAGLYTIVNDAWLSGHSNTTALLRAKGFINGVEVFNEPYTISADCCHVSKVSGKDVIVLP